MFKLYEYELDGIRSDGEFRTAAKALSEAQKEINRLYMEEGEFSEPEVHIVTFNGDTQEQIARTYKGVFQPDTLFASRKSDRAEHFRQSDYI